MSVFEKMKRKSMSLRKKANDAASEGNGPSLDPIKRPGEEVKPSTARQLGKFFIVLFKGVYKGITGSANLVQKTLYLAIVFFMLYMGYKAYNMVTGVTSSISSLVSGQAIKEKAKAATESVKEMLEEKNATARVKASAEKLKDAVHDKAPAVAAKAGDLKAAGLEKARAAKERLKAEMANHKEAAEQRRQQELSREVVYIDVVTLQPIPDGKEEVIPEELAKQVEEDLETLKIEVKN
jgi:hypothetical protein